jgi:hypothetical protein
MNEYLKTKSNQENFTNIDDLLNFPISNVESLNPEMIDELKSIYNLSLTKANLHFETQEYRDALFHYFKIYKIFKKFSRIVDQNDISNIVLNIANCNYELNNFDESLQFYCSYCTMTILSNDFKTKIISDYDNFIAIIDKILAISSSIEDAKTYKDYMELKTELSKKYQGSSDLSDFKADILPNPIHGLTTASLTLDSELQGQNDLENIQSQIDIFLEQIKSHLKFSNINYSFNNNKVGNNHLISAENIYDKIIKIVEEKNGNLMSINLLIGNLFYDQHFFEHALFMYCEGYTPLKQQFDSEGSFDSELQYKMVHYLLKIANCQIHLEKYHDASLSADLLSLIDPTNTELPSLLSYLNEIKAEEILPSKYNQGTETLLQSEQLDQGSQSPIINFLPDINTVKNEDNSINLSSPEISVDLGFLGNSKLSSSSLDFRTLDNFQKDDIKTAHNLNLMISPNAIEISASLTFDNSVNLDEQSGQPTNLSNLSISGNRISDTRIDIPSQAHNSLSPAGSNKLSHKKRICIIS